MTAKTDSHRLIVLDTATGIYHDDPNVIRGLTSGANENKDDFDAILEREKRERRPAPMSMGDWSKMIATAHLPFGYSVNMMSKEEFEKEYPQHIDSVFPKSSTPKPVFIPQRTQSGWDLSRAEYRKLRDRAGICYDPRIDLSEYEIVGYMGGGEELKANGLTFDHFDSIAEICVSKHPRKQQERHHFTGSRDAVVTILNCRKIK